MTIGQKAFRTQAALAAALLSAAAGPAAAGASDTYYERAFVMAADARCDLFQPRLGAALAAATAQSRGAALRAGASDVDLSQTRARADRRAAATPCAHPDLARVADRVETAFEGWARTPRMVFAGWSADRTLDGDDGWSLSQASRVGASPVVLGRAAGDRTTVTAVVAFTGPPRPYAARLVLRDAAKAPRPWLAAHGLAPAGFRDSLWATGVAPADQALLPGKARQGEAWAFPAATLDALQALDPREAFALEFHFRDGTVATARFQVGDLAAAHAFVGMGAL